MKTTEKLPHHHRLGEILQLFEPGAARPEQTVPEVLWHIDWILFMPAPSLLWGPLAHRLANRQVVLEHYSRAPTKEDLTRAVVKAHLCFDQWQRGEDSSIQAPPILVVLSEGYPRRAFDAFPELKLHSIHVGVFDLSTWLCEGLFVCLKRLPRQSSWGFLKSIPTGSLEKHMRLLKRMLYSEDDALRSATSRFIEAIHTTKIRGTAMEQKNSFQLAVDRGIALGIDRGRDEGIALGRDEGIAQGRDEGRALFLKFARRHLSQEEILELEEIKDLELLEAAIAKKLDLGV